MEFLPHLAATRAEIRLRPEGGRISINHSGSGRSRCFRAIVAEAAPEPGYALYPEGIGRILPQFPGVRVVNDGRYVYIGTQFQWLEGTRYTGDVGKDIEMGPIRPPIVALSADLPLPLLGQYGAGRQADKSA